MNRLILLPRAEVDVFDAAIWYETERDGLGRTFEDELDQVLARITDSPLQFPELEPQVRRALLGRFPYGAFFVVEDTVLTVFAVLHLHRDPETWRHRR